MTQINFLTAVNFVLKHEGGVYKNTTTGEYSNFGITQTFLKSFPYFITNPLKLSREDAVNIYYQQFWNKYGLYQLYSIKVAAKLFDMMVNMGNWEAVKLLQDVLFPNEAAMQDGILGIHTRSFLNQIITKNNSTEIDSIGEDRIIQGLIDKSVEFYNTLASGPNLEKLDAKNMLKGWLIRANDKL